MRNVLCDSKQQKLIISFKYAPEQQHNISFLILNKVRRSFQLVINLFLFAGRATFSIFPLCRHSVQFARNSIKCWNENGKFFNVKVGEANELINSNWFASDLCGDKIKSSLSK